MGITLETHSDSEPRRSPLTPKDQLEWVPLPQHPLFTATSGGGSGARNLLAWDGASRLYFWDSNNNFLHRLSLRLGDPDPTSVLAATSSKVLQADAVINFDIQKISINRNGTAMLLFGSQRLCVMYLYGCTSKNDVNLICRTNTVGSNTYSNGSNDIRLLQALWHPYSDTHLGILSSDSVFRLFNLAVDPLQPEQEYYLQPMEPGRSRNASSVCPVDFSFGGDHLWDRFSVFISFSDGAIYVLCPLVPFGSLFKCESLLEIYNDAHTFGLESANSVAASNSKLAISWLEATFPELPNQETEGDSLSVLRAHAYALFDASLVLQGPLQRVGQGGNEDSVGRSAECEGRAVSFLYNLVSKDSILVTAWSGGQLQIDALADEIQPVWSVGSPPRLRVDSHDQIVGLTMICESIASGRLEELDHNAWLGNPPPLLRLAIVDLALPRRAESGYNISLCIDTLMPERIYSLNDGGVDSMVLHFLPFTSQTNGKDDAMRTPFVHPVLNTCQSGCTSEPSLCGFVSLSDSFGYSWIVAVTLSQECVVLEMKTWNLLLPVSIDTEKKPIQSEGESKETDISTIISKELLSGPKEVLIPQASPSLRSVAADSIEGRSTLHQYFKLFHETYVEYAHKVYLELKHHAPQLKKIINYQHSCLGDAQQKLLKVEEKQSILQKRIDRAIQMHNSLEKRLQRLRNLPCAHKRPLSRAERQFKSELDHFREVELDALHSSVDALSARLRRHMQASKASHQQKISGKKICAGDDQISMFKSSLEKLSFIHDSPVTSRRSRTPSPPSPQRGSIPSQGIQTPIAEEISQAPSAQFEGHFEPEVQPVNLDFPERDMCIETSRDATHPEDTQAVVQEHSSHQLGQDQLEADQPAAAETPACPPEVIETVDDNGGDDVNIGSLNEDDDEDDPLKLIEDILFGKTSIFSKSHHSTAHSEAEVQSISTTQLLQELAILLNSGLDQLMASEENKHKMITLLKQLGQHNQLLNPDVRQVLQKLRGLFEYLMSNFCDFQQAITDHQQLLDARAKLINDVTKAKGRRSKLHTALSTAQERLYQNEAKIVELKAQLQEIEEQQENLRAAVDIFTTQERQLKSDCSKWVVESKDVMLAIETSTPAFEKASTERKKAEENLRSLQFFFNHL